MGRDLKVMGGEKGLTVLLIKRRTAATPRGALVADQQLTLKRFIEISTTPSMK
jgi:hypothetical protein